MRVDLHQQASFPTSLLGIPSFKIGELHTTFYLCFLVLLVYLSLSSFSCVSLFKNPKKNIYLVLSLFLVVVSMSSSFTFSASPEAEVIAFRV